MDKPAGLKVHPGPGGGPSVEDWFGLLSRRRDGPWLAHRLDADTSGCLLIALRRAALHAAQTCFAEGRAGKTYWAVVSGVPATPAGTIDLPLHKQSRAGSGWRMIAAPDGLPARTRYTVLGRTDTTSWLELELLSGRTHQARVHCASLGCPILGDTLYGSAAPGPMQLLARRLTLPLNPPVAAVAPPPPHMIAALGACGWQPDR
ncbi:RNA pseudouridine synthase [Lichenicoccus roseus]|uniref:RNA pseudouridine synthase n=1 Tax=Lichenicoccus roseus TaxID=2683649 RepID=A0A5R9J2S5_9PROT|nr:RNA pseudouridine synthase [Lichenicoccus roseus]TLU71924.1 RNA pseudouridine synthase [Lichenicoccus roseus]